MFITTRCLSADQHAAQRRGVHQPSLCGCRPCGWYQDSQVSSVGVCLKRWCVVVIRYIKLAFSASLSTHWYLAISSPFNHSPIISRCHISSSIIGHCRMPISDLTHIKWHTCRQAQDRGGGRWRPSPQQGKKCTLMCQISTSDQIFPSRGKCQPAWMYTYTN